MKITIGIPARYGSTRFPGKPLVKIGGKTMLQRVVEIARETASTFESLPNITVDFFITTEDKRIADHARNDLGAPVIMTGDTCKTGSDRILAALRQLDEWPDFIINLQGDAPFTPVHVIKEMIRTFIDDPDLQVITPVHALSWEALDTLRESKKISPFSGTTAIVDDNDNAVWFSKNIIPAIRDEQKMKEQNAPCPVLQHMGLYGYQPATLEKFCAFPQGRYEILEGLEQLRFLENNIPIHTIKVEINSNTVQSGIDTPEDAKAAEAMLVKQS